METEAKHTPGPWQVREHWTHEEKFEVFPVRDVELGEPAEIAEVCAHYADGGDAEVEEAMANAHLIAAAPEMLEALKAEEEADKAFEDADEHTHRAEAEGWLNDPTGSCHVAESWSIANDLRAKAKALRRKAIAKAEGRSDG